MTDAQKLAFILKALKEIFGKNIDNISLDDTLVDLGLDSLDIVELQMYYEDKMGTEIETDVILLTIKDLMSVMK